MFLGHLLIDHSPCLKPYCVFSTLFLLLIITYSGVESQYGSSLWWVSFYLLTPSSILVQVLGGLPSSWLQFHVLVGFAQFLWYFFRIITNLKQLNVQNIFLRIIYLLINIYIYIYIYLNLLFFYHFQEGKFKIKDFIVVIKHNAMRFWPGINAIKGQSKLISYNHMVYFVTC